MYINILPVAKVSNIECMMQQLPKLYCYKTRKWVGIKPVIKNIVPNYNLFAAESKKLPSLEA